MTTWCFLLFGPSVCFWLKMKSFSREKDSFLILSCNTMRRKTKKKHELSQNLFCFHCYNFLHDRFGNATSSSSYCTYLKANCTASIVNTKIFFSNYSIFESVLILHLIDKVKESCSDESNQHVMLLFSYLITLKLRERKKNCYSLFISNEC